MDTLFNLTDQAKTLIDLASSADPAEMQVFNDTLEAVLGEIEVKADAYANELTILDGREETVQKEIERLTAMKDNIENAKKRMKSALLETMDTLSINEIKTDLHRFKCVNNGGLQPLKITSIVPDEYTRQEITVKPDMDKIRKALADGQELSFAHLEGSGKHLKID
jgi:hypothetical protein